MPSHHRLNGSNTKMDVEKRHKIYILLGHKDVIIVAKNKVTIIKLLKVSFIKIISKYYKYFYFIVSYVTRIVFLLQQ